ncbi:hypothetical protein BpHYR1_002795 [Brachionus plicatilis]|uniref:Uncharacterized protein n=1 Tax=Brachionus plicatilis TaxID=10195 RepID=A0A3M7PJ12_BRAPC|nr:hypothetical protein BpHYR1_002795 [Brachionus plicatilis]
MRHLPDWSAFLTTTNDQNNPPNFFFQIYMFYIFSESIFNGLSKNMKKMNFLDLLSFAFEQNHLVV